MIPPAVGIDRDLFLRVLTAHMAFLADMTLGPEAAPDFLRKLGENVGRWIEDQYREAWGLDGPLTREQFEALIVDFKRRVGACLEARADGERSVCLRNTRCPFTDVALGADVLCRLDADIFGTIAARNLGRVQLIGHSTLVTRGERCAFELNLDPKPVPPDRLAGEYLPPEGPEPWRIHRDASPLAALERLRREVGASQAALAQANRSLRALLDASATISANLHAPDLLAQVARCAASLAGGTVGFAAEGEGDRLRLTLWREGDEPSQIEVPWQSGSDLGSRCFRERRSLVSEPGDAGEPLYGTASAEADHPWVCVPVVSPQGETFGVVGAQTKGNPAGALHMMESLAHQTASALANVRLYAAQEREAERTRRLLAELQEKNRVLAEVQDRLVDAEKLAAVGLFGQAIAHEVRNPLGVIRTALLNLRGRLNPADALAVRACTVADEQVSRADQIIRDMLALTQQRPPVPASVSLAAVAREAVGSLPVPPGVRVVVDVADDLPPAWVDAGHVQQIVLNLCQNALDALKGAGAIHVRAEAAGDTIRLSVADNGCGIPPECLPFIFRPLWTTKGRGGKGFGIGLALCRALAERNGGTLTVESTVGAGSTFTLTLPTAAREG